MKIKYLFFLLSLVTLFASCDNDTDPVLPQYSPTVMTHPENGIRYELKQEEAANDLFTLSYTVSTQQELAVGAISYYLQVDLAGRNFAAPVVLAQQEAVKEASDNSPYTVAVNVKELNNVLTNTLGIAAGEEANVEFRIITHIGNTLLASTASNVFEAQVIPYELSRESLFFVGSMFGQNEWDNANYKFVLFRSTPDAVDTYTGKFVGGSAFKFISQANLGTWDKAYGAAASGILSLTGGDIADISTEGYYTLTVNTAGLTYSIEPYDASKAPTYQAIGLIGAFNDWASDLALTQATYDPHIWFVDDLTLPAGELKFRANNDWANSWGGDSFPYGGGSGNNITVAAGTYYVVFNDLTGEYVFLAK